VRSAPLLAAVAALAACASAPSAPPAAPRFADPAAWEIVDLTRVLDEAIPYWPGTKYFRFESWDLARMAEVGAFSRAYRVPEHYGTHVDAPAHFAEGQATMEGIPATALVGPAVVFDIRARAAADPDATLTAADVAAWEEAHGRVPEGAIAFLLTGWGDRWPDVAAYRNFDERDRLRFPSFGPDAARVLLVERGCRGLGVDALSVDRGIDEEFPVHRLGSGLGRWFLENAANLERLPPAGAFVVVGAVPMRGASGAQARVLAFVPR
jgi:kynurenine formamidase